MPELPSLLREGMSEIDYKVCCDRLKPDLDNLTGRLLCSHITAAGACKYMYCIWCACEHIPSCVCYAKRSKLLAGVLNGLVKCKDLALNGKVCTTGHSIALSLHTMHSVCTVLNSNGPLVVLQHVCKCVRATGHRCPRLLATGTVIGIVNACTFWHWQLVLRARNATTPS